MLSDMRRIAVILLIIALFNTNVKAEEERNSRLIYGIEWSFVSTVHSGYHYNFFAPEGYRVDNYGNSFMFRPNADMYAFLGYDFKNCWTMSVYLGYTGISNFHDAVPISIRATRYFGTDSENDRWFAFIDAGSGISLKRPVQEILSGKIGGGYSLALSRDTALDLVLAARMIYTHPQITYDKQIIGIDKINRSNAYVSAVSIGLSLHF